MTPMVLYLCQHGEALAKDVDPDRPLSEQGIADVRGVADVLDGRVSIQAVAHSGKTRARQTAELLHERLAPEASLDAEPGLGPNDPVDVVAERIAARGENLMIVGHMPFIGHLGALLLKSPDELLAFEPATVAALERNADNT